MLELEESWQCSFQPLPSSQLRLRLRIAQGQQHIPPGTGVNSELFIGSNTWLI